MSADCGAILSAVGRGRRSRLAGLTLAAVVLAGCGAAARGATSPPSTTTTTDALAQLRALARGDAPNPWHLYPRRPGARPNDVERRVGQRVDLGLSSVQLVGAHRKTAAEFAAPHHVAAHAEPSRIDAFAPRFTTDVRGYLAVDLVAAPLPVGDAPPCTLTRAVDGAMIASARADDAGVVATSTTTTTVGAHTSDLSALLGTRRVVVWFAIGATRGPFYVACGGTATASLFASDVRGVWKVDA